jgi:hypothetical protein
MVQVRFPFTPPATVAQELAAMVKATKIVLQQAINDL